MSNSRQTNPMLDLFCSEAQDKLSLLSDSILSLSAEQTNQDEIKSSDFAIASVKGAAKIASLEQVFELSKAMEGVLAATAKNKILFSDNILSALMLGINLISDLIIASETDLTLWLDTHGAVFVEVTTKLLTLISSGNEIIAETTKPKKENPKSNPNSKTKNKTKAKPEKTAVTETLADVSMLELFRMESESQTEKLSMGLMELESSPDNAELLESLMRAAHSLKGAARMVGLESLVTVSHIMEDVFVAAQNGKFIIDPDDMDILLASVDMLSNMAKATSENYDQWLNAHLEQLDELQSALDNILQQKPRKKLSYIKNISESNVVDGAIEGVSSTEIDNESFKSSNIKRDVNLADNVVRVSAESLNRLQGLAGEALVESRWLGSYAESLLLVKKRQVELVILIDQLREKLFDAKANEVITDVVHDVQGKANECRELLTSSLSNLESFDRRSSNLSSRLHRDVLQARMRPFSDGVRGFQRLVRELSRALNKDIKLDIQGMNTQVDRDILDKLQAPLNHMIRNAVDHGIETPEERLAVGKPAQGKIRLEAMHTAGMLSIVVEDDGRGIDLGALREKIVSKKMVNEKMADSLSEHELLDFMFLPNFSTRDDVTEISGRGVGLDVVHKVVQELRGQIRSSTELGKGIRFQYQLPLTLSVIRALVVNIDDEPFAFPLARIDQTIKIDKRSIETMEGRQYFTYGNQHIGLISAHQILEKKSDASVSDEISIVVLSDRLHKYGVVVDEFLGERNLVVHTLDPRLGKIQDISSASLTENGEPLLIFDVDDLFRSIDLILSGGRLNHLSSDNEQEKNITKNKRVLVVDDSITVREVERNLLQSSGYLVEVAVDGMDGWNAARTNHYDLIVSDIDMPRMNGFEFVSMLKGDERLKSVPVIIVSYKDREEDRLRGLEVGADYYLTKGSFHDDSLIEAVIDLIGEP